MSVEVIRADSLSRMPHGFLGRRGGVSTGILAGLNVGIGSSDKHDAIEENRRRAIASVLAGAKLATVHQVHSAETVRVDEPWPDGKRPRADSMVTDEAGLLLGILTADCAPVLFADPQAGIVGAAHAGWRGALAGVTDRTIEAMERIGAKRDRIVAAIGPCIACPSYQVDDDFRQRFLDSDPNNDRFFATSAGERPHFDLEGYVESRLKAGGIAKVEALGLDTYCDPARFYSYRRSTHRDEPDYGRQIALIGLAP